MIELRENELVFRFPEVHEDAVLEIGFQRTLRIPDDNREYPLPPGLGTFPLGHVDDSADRLPAEWNQHGGVFLPMHQAEAMWIDFTADYPMAVKVAAGKINALTGEPWKDALTAEPQDYLVVPEQPWLDGFCVEKGLIRQFVAMPLGDGYSAEEQLTGEARHGGLQIAVYPMETSRYERMRRRERRLEEEDVSPLLSVASASMGLAPGGLMRQEIYEDPHGFDAWERSARSRCFVHILNSAQFLNVTGYRPPQEPPTAQAYAEVGLPWFDYYGGDLKALGGAKSLTGLDSVAAKTFKKGGGILPGNEPVVPAAVEQLSVRRVREGDFGDEPSWGWCGTSRASMPDSGPESG